MISGACKAVTPIDTTKTFSESLTTRVAAIASDELLLLRAKEGDREALGTLFERYKHLIFVIGKRILGKDDRAEDLVQEVFVYLLRKSNTFDPTKGSAKKWLIQTVYHRAFDYLEYLRQRHGQWTRRLTDGSDEASDNREFATSEENEGERRYWQSRFLMEFRKLPAKHRQAIILYFWEGLTFPEIDAKLCCNAKNSCYRGIKRLRKALFDNDRNDTKAEDP